ncbi:MAG TPA: FG-GAP-like repeat-containing protein [Vicinamibacterales bacterium]|nr:FG-GAP-like repeat-containing protein [Vicinamibacterales bacterium]
MLSKRTTLTTLAMVLLSAAQAAAIPITLAWDRNPEPDVVRYLVSYGTSRGIYSVTRDAGNNTTVDIDGLTRGQTYYFVVRAVNSDGVVSDPSQELAYLAPMYPPQEPVFYNPATGTWSAPMTDVDNPGSSPASVPGWNVYEADFNNDGYTDFLLYNPVSGAWKKLTNQGHGTYAYFGNYNWSAGWVPQIADFNGDGSSDLLLYNPANGRWYVGLANGLGDFAYVQSGIWSAGWTVTVANLNGDNRADLFMYNGNPAPDPNSGRWFRVLTRADISFDYREGPVRWSTGWQVHPADFDANGQGDLFLYNPASGRYFQVMFSGDTASYYDGAWSAGWEVHTGDFNGDRRTDIFVYNPVTGRWFEVISGLAPRNFSYYEGAWSPAWRIKMTDFNHDGRTDLHVYDSTTGRYYEVTTVGIAAFDYLMGYNAMNAIVSFAGSR